MSKSATVSITFEVGKVKFVDIPEYFEPGSMIDGKASTFLIPVAEAFTMVWKIEGFPSLLQGFGILYLLA